MTQRRLNETALRSWMERAQRKAGLRVNKGQIHILRHTFCSRLAMKGVPAKVIQELAGHADLRGWLASPQRFETVRHPSLQTRDGALRHLRSPGWRACRDGREEAYEAHGD
jgi:site-specific recombinase XerD